MTRRIDSPTFFVDAHVHMGYYPRFGCKEPFYYSPRRVFGVLARCGISEFIVSTTNSQLACITLNDIIREAREMRRIAGAMAHQLLWVSGRILDEDPLLASLDASVRPRGRCSDGEIRLYEGVKLHGVETPWMTSRKSDLRRVLDAAAERNMVVQIHTADDFCCHPHGWGRYAQLYPSVMMDFSHCKPMVDTMEVMRTCPNVYTDISFLGHSEVDYLLKSDVSDRVMFGSDLPAYHAFCSGTMTSCYRKRVSEYCRSEMDKMAHACKSFLTGAV